MRALNIGLAPTWYTPKSEADNLTPTRFLLRGLDGVEQGELVAVMPPDENDEIAMDHRAFGVALKYGLMDWENFLDANDKPIEFEGKRARERQALIPYVVQAELASRIFELTFITQEEKKS